MRIKQYIADIALCIAIAALTILPFVVSGANAPTGFTQNKGQIHDQHRKPNPSVLYLLNGRSMNVQLKNDGFAYDTYVVPHPLPLSQGEGRNADPGDGTRSVDPVLRHSLGDGGMGRPAMDAQPTTYQFHRIDIQFVKGNPDAEIIADGQSEDYTNYYTDVTGEPGATFVRSYSTVTYRNVWPNIDVCFNISEEGFKYDVIVRPGGSLDDARFEVKGAAISESLKGRLVFTWADGILEEMIPDSWVEKGRRKSGVDVRYEVGADGRFGFVAEMHGEGTLVIDPVVDWVTYYGGGSGDSPQGVDMDPAGNTYLMLTTGSDQAMATSGTWDNTINGTNDVCIAKFTPSGMRLWGTYYGGAQNDDGLGLDVDPNGKIAVCGQTRSTAGIASAGTFQTQLRVVGETDGFLALFNTNGLRLWGTYYGGTLVDIAEDCSIGSLGNVALGGWTRSSDFIASAGAPDVTFATNGTNSDAFVAWFSSTGTRLWGSYLGGTGYDSMGSILATGTSTFVVVGSTSSTSGIATSNGFDPTYNGGGDAFYAGYSAIGSGSKVWSTYYGGSGTDYATDVVLTSSSTVVFCGTTESSSGIATLLAPDMVYSGNKDAFYVSFTLATHTRQWASYLGTSVIDYAVSLAPLANGGFAISLEDEQFTTNPARKMHGFNGNGFQIWSITGAGGHLGAHGDALAAAHGTNQAGLATAGAHQTQLGDSFKDALLRRYSGAAPPAQMPLIDEGEDLRMPYRITLIDKSISINPQPGGVDASTVHVSLLDASGRPVLMRNNMTSNGTIALNELAGGAYIVVLTYANGTRQAQRFFIP